MVMNYSPEVMANMAEWIEKQNVILETEIIEAQAKEFQASVDREILWGMLENLGWTRVILSTLVDNNHAVDITYWLKDNCKYAYERHGRDFMFESAKDANWFKLRWVS